MESRQRWCEFLNHDTCGHPGYPSTIGDLPQIRTAYLSLRRRALCSNELGDRCSSPSPCGLRRGNLHSPRSTEALPACQAVAREVIEGWSAREDLNLRSPA